MAFSGMVHTASAQQTNTNTIDPQNCRQGETVEYCRQHTYHAELLNNPAYVQSLAEDDAIRAQEQLNGQPESQTIYYIPVVFHLLHNNGVEHITDEQILDAFDILNRDYMLQNADANNVVSAFNASNPSAAMIPDTAFIQFEGK